MNSKFPTCIHPSFFQLVNSFLIFSTVVVGSSIGQTIVAEDKASSIGGDPSVASSWVPDPVALSRVTEDLATLSSDEMGGRMPGTPGIKLAEDYLVAQFTEMGLQPLENGTYLQEFEVRSRTIKVRPQGSSLSFSGPDGKLIELDLDKDWRLLTSRRKFELDTEMVFVGYGVAADELNFNEYDGIDVADKVVVLIRTEPSSDSQESAFNRERATRHASGSSKAMAARRAGAAAVLMVNDSNSAMEGEGDELIPSDRFGTMSVPFAQIKRATLEQILKVSPIRTPTGDTLDSVPQLEKYIGDKQEPLSQAIADWKVSFKGDFSTSNISTNNVIGIIEGEGPLAHETIVIGAHYDHIGDGGFGSRTPGRRGEVHNGADDNATGTVAVLELARRFAAAGSKPPRRIVFICFSAEEMGLLGAVHYVDNPEFPLEDTVMMFNFDMIGWLRNEELSMINWNSSPVFSAALDEVNENYGFEMQILKPRSSPGGSDHMPFNARNIPNLFFHTGLHEVYHTPDDTFERVDCEGMLKVIDYGEKLIQRMIALPKRPSFGPPPPFRLGITLVEDAESAEIEEVIEGSPAALAGLLPGDVVLAIDQTEINRPRIIGRIVREKEGQTVRFKLKRNDAEILVDVELVDHSSASD